MTTYIVTAEIKTSCWLKLLRFFKIKNKRIDFYLTLDSNMLEKNEVIALGNGKELKMVNKVSR